MRLCKTPRYQVCQLETTRYSFTHRQNISEQDVQSMTCFIKGSKSGHKDLKEDMTRSYVVFFLSSLQVTSACPRWAAWCRGVLPSLSVTSRLQTYGMRAAAQPVAQFAAAMCSGVCQNLSRALSSALCFRSSSTALCSYKKNIYIYKHITCQTVKSSSCLFKCLWFKKVYKSTSFLEAAARCKGVSKPWSLEFTFAPVIERKIKNKLFSCTRFVRFSPYAVIKTSLVYLHL